MQFCNFAWEQEHQGRGYRKTWKRKRISIKRTISITHPIYFSNNHQHSKYHTQIYHTTQDTCSLLHPSVLFRRKARNPSPYSKRKTLSSIIIKHQLSSSSQSNRIGTVNPKSDDTIPYKQSNNQITLAMLAHSNHE